MICFWGPFIRTGRTTKIYLCTVSRYERLLRIECSSRTWSRGAILHCSKYWTSSSTTAKQWWKSWKTISRETTTCILYADTVDESSLLYQVQLQSLTILISLRGRLLSPTPLGFTPLRGFSLATPPSALFPMSPSTLLLTGTTSSVSFRLVLILLTLPISTAPCWFPFAASPRSSYPHHSRPPCCHRIVPIVRPDRRLLCFASDPARPDSRARPVLPNEPPACSPWSSKRHLQTEIMRAPTALLRETRSDAGCLRCGFYLADLFPAFLVAA